jgi:hypothetical protein
VAVILEHALLAVTPGEEGERNIPWELCRHQPPRPPRPRLSRLTEFVNRVSRLGGLAGTWSGDSAEELDGPTVSERSEREVDCDWGDLSETDLDRGIGTAVGAQGPPADTPG